jgi:hypothetical protein
MTYLLVFCLAVLIDVLWTLNVKWVAQDEPLKASLVSAALVTCSGISVYLYVENPWLIPFSAAGAFVGSMLVLRRKLPKDDHLPSDDVG